MRDGTEHDRRRAGPRDGNGRGAPALLGLVVFLACLFGIWTRTDDFLAALWPANALMLGLQVRVPRMARPSGWLCAAAGYLAADLLTGAGLAKAVVLNAANLLGVAAAYLIYFRMPVDIARLRHPMSMLYLVLAAAAAGLAAAMVGGVANPLLYDGSALRGSVFWFATEFVNYVAFLPVILSLPAPGADLRGAARRALAGMVPRRLLPVAALALSCLAAQAIGGPGAIAFPVPALLWCGLSYPVFPTAALTLASGSWILMALPHGVPDGSAAGRELLLVSLRLGVSLLAVAPIMVSCVMQGRNELLARLRHLATHDALTGASSRSAFYEQAGRLMQGPGPVGALMIDLDHFKRVNDTYGHAAGDEVLAAMAGRIGRCLRADDLFGRLGGEEFAAVVAGLPGPQLSAVAERIREAVAREPVSLPGGGAVLVTVSIGLALRGDAGDADPDRLLAQADAALYRAKRTGRDRVAVHGEDHGA